MIILEDGFWNELDESKIVTVTGRLGCGKTMLGLEIAERYLRRGYRLYTNVSSVWADSMREGEVVGLESIEKGIKAVVLVDEGGLYIRSKASVSALSSFARKLNNIVIISGKRTPHEELCELVVSPWFDLRRNFLIPLYIWRYDVEGYRKNYHGFIIEGPRFGIKGTYSTVDPGNYPERVVEITQEWAEQLFKKYGQHYQLSDLAKGRGDDGTSLESSLEDFQKSIRDFVSVQRGSGGRGRALRS